MTYFSVTTLKRGKKKDIIIKANSKESAAQLVKSEHNLKAIKIKSIEPPLEAKIKDMFDLASKAFSKKSKVSLDDLIPAFQQMSMMLNAGISINHTLEELVEFTENDKLKRIFSDAIVGLNGGKSLTDSFRSYREDLGNLTISMIDLGEQTGNLSDALIVLYETLEDVRDNIAKFKKALRYPLITITAMAIAFVVLILLVVPKFKSIFATLKADLPLPTIILLETEYLLTNFGHYMLAGLVIFVIAVMRMYKKNEVFHYNFDKYILKVKLIGRVTFLYSMNQYMTTLAQLLRAGISLEEALKNSSKMVTNYYLKERFETITDSIRKGVGLVSAFRDTDIFEGTVLQMVGAGEQSGNLDEMLKVAGNYYKTKYDAIVDNLSAYIEPILTGFIAALVLLLALGIFMPMWDLASAAKGG